MKKFGMQEPENVMHDMDEDILAPFAAEDEEAAADNDEGGADVLAIYLEEVQNIPAFHDGEEKELIFRAAAGDPGARDRLMEGHLKFILEIVREHMGGPLGISEMIGISNLGLVKAIRLYLDHAAAMIAKNKEFSLETPSLRDTIANTVKEDIGAAEQRERAEKREGDEIASRANLLMEAARVMAEELGREATKTELAERMKLPEEEVEQLLKMAMQAIEGN